MFASKDVFLSKSGAAGAYTIARSVRFRSSATASLSRTFSTTGTSRQIFTLSVWVKRGTLGAIQQIMGCYDGSVGAATGLYFTASDTLNFDYGGTVQYQILTTQVFRDPSSWYHIVVACDSTQATAANRVKIYVNGSQVTAFSTANYPAQNANGQWMINTANNKIGTQWNSASNWLDGYLSEMNFVDGQALTPSSFGTIGTNGVWQPTRYTGTYGTNGFYLKFNSYATAAALGTDSSGNSNTWTVNNISVTAGATYDAMQDTPTLTSLDAANYAVLNPLANNAGGAGTVSNGNMALSVSSSQMTYLRPLTIAISSGQWYLEAIVNSDNSQQYSQFGIIQQSQVSSSGALNTLSTSYGLTVTPTYVNYATFQGSTITQYGTRATGAVTAQIAFDATNGKIWIGVNNTWLGGGNPSTGATPTYSGIAAANWYFAMFIGNTSGANNCSVNLGQQPFTYTAPTGFVALNTYNLATPTIANGAAYMAATTYTGTGASLTVANTVNGVSFQPDFVWIKGRSGATDHALYDVVRGTTKDLASNTTAAETTQATGLTAFGSTGFTVGALAKLNTNAATYVGWQWLANGTGVSNTSGSITSTVSAGATQGVAVVTYTGTGAAATVGHGLGAVPSMIIVKKRSAAGTAWAVYNVNIGAANALVLNSTAASSAQNYWNSTTPTSSVWSMTGNAEVNGSTETYVAYCFAPVAGYSAFGSYTGNGSTDGPFVYLGFRPKYVLIKRTDSIGDWFVFDTSRDTYNAATKDLSPNSSTSEGTGDQLDILSNGFKLRTTTASRNASGGTYIYACFAENPFKYSLAR